MDKKRKKELGFICSECEKTLYEGKNPPGHIQYCEECKNNRNELKEISY